MADITVAQERFYGQIETIANPNPRLASPLKITDLIIPLTGPIYKEGGVIPTLDFSFVIKDLATGYPEQINVQTGEVSADGKTITLAGLNQRGIDPAGEDGIDFFSGSADRRYAHGQNSECRISISALDYQQLSDAQKGKIASGGASWLLGRDIDEDIFVYAANGDVNKPYFAYDSGTNDWIYSKDGISSTPFGTGAGVTGGNGITVVAGVIAVDTTDTTIFKTTTAGAADEDKVVKLNASGLIGIANVEILKDVTATAAELNIMDGYTGSTANLNTLTGGSDASALHTHTRKIGAVQHSVASGVSTLNIDHGLGYTPTWVKIDAMSTGGNDQNVNVLSLGEKNGGTHATVFSGYSYNAGGDDPQATGISTTKIIYIQDVQGAGDVLITATVALTATQIQLSLNNSAAAVKVIDIKWKTGK